MSDEWMPHIELPITWEQFHQLPRNGAYKYEYLGGRALLSPRPRHFHAILDLQPFTVEEAIAVHPVTADDFPAVERLFGAAFRDVQPYGGLDQETRAQAAHRAVEKCRNGGDGPLIEQASFVALSEDRQKLVGAILITLLPDGDPCDWSTYYWSEAPPADCILRRLGRPHLTWIFVSPLERGRSVGTALLAASVRELHGLGYRSLLSTFMLGNEWSALWHWR